MLVVKEKYEAMYEINRSKFIGLILPLNTQDDPKEIIAQIKKEYPKATYYCYAYRVDGKEKSNDDGEPSGTAGRPLLEVLKNNDLENVLLVVVRYFGGIKLGAGGLLRAYVKSGVQVIESAIKYEVEKVESYLIETTYSYYEAIYSYFNKNGFMIVNSEFGENIYIEVIGRIDMEYLRNLTRGQVKISSLEPQVIYRKV